MRSGTFGKWSHYSRLLVALGVIGFGLLRPDAGTTRLFQIQHLCWLVWARARKVGEAMKVMSVLLARSCDMLVCIACLSYPSENELALLKSVLDLTGHITDSLHCSLGVSWCASTSSCLFSFFYLNWLYAMTKFLCVMANSLAGV